MVTKNTELTPVVSIHASVKDATILRMSEGKKQQGFNPRVREGRDATLDRKRPSCRCFNPRVREGRDSKD